MTFFPILLAKVNRMPTLYFNSNGDVENDTDVTDYYGISV